MRTRLLLSTLILSLFVLSAPAFSQIFQWKDDKGNTHFSDTPPPNKDVRKLKAKEAARQERTGSQDLKGTDKRPYRDIRVIMYMTDWCPYCVKARDLLNSFGVNLVEYNVDRDKEKSEEAKMKTGGARGVPVLDIEGIIIRGYSPERIKAAVEKRRDSL